MIKRILFVVTLVLLTSLCTYAQETKKFTLQECVTIALENNYQLRYAQMSVELAKQDVISSRSGWLPQLNSYFTFGKHIQGESTYLTSVPVGVDSSGTYIYEERLITDAQTERNSYGASLSLDQHIYNFGRTGNRIRQAKAYQQYQEHSLFNTRNLVIADVQDKYFELLKAQKLYDVYNEAVQHAEENLTYNQTMLDVGLKSQAEIFQAKVNLGIQKTQLITQKNSIEFAKAALNSAMGLNPAEQIDVEEDLPQPIFPEYDFNGAIEIAFENNERLKAVEQELRATEYAIRSAKALYAPSIDARISYDRNNDDISRVYSSELNKDFAATIGTGVNFNIFRGLADKAEIQKQIIYNQQIMEKLNEEKRILVVDIRQYFLALQTYEDIITINRENLAAYQENLRLHQEKRRVGSGTELEVMQAQVDVVQAQETLVAAEYEAKIARAYLEAALGIIGKENN